MSEPTNTEHEARRDHHLDEPVDQPLVADEPVHLKRALGVVSLTLFGLVYLVPLTAFATYGIVTEMTGGRVATAYIVTLVVMLFTALSYAAMVRAYPVSGSAYTYTQRSFGRHAGFLSGWALILDYLFLPMINYLLIGIYMSAEFPTVPAWAWVIIAIVFVTTLNIVGITSIARVNIGIIAAQGIFVVVFIALAAKTVTAADAVRPLAPFVGDGSVTGAGVVLAGAAVLCLSFLGFDAVSTMAEEAQHPRRDIPRAVVLVTVIGGLVFIALSYFGQLALPATTFTDADSGSLDVMMKVGGAFMAKFFIAAFVAGSFGSAMTSQASVTRIIYTMGRDGVFPHALGRLSPRFQTPILAIIIVSIVSLVATVIDLTLLASLISFGALAAFSVVNLSVIKHYVVDNHQRSSRQ